MKYINLNGQTLPEMLKSMQSKINELIEHYSMLRAYATSENYNGDENIYQISALSFSEGFENGTIVVFTKNSYIGVARNVDTAAGTYYVESVGTIRGGDGAIGQKGEDGNGIVEISDGTPAVNGEYTVTPINVSLSKTPEQHFDVAAKNGNGIVTAHSLSHRTEGDEEITTVELVTDDGTNPQIEIHAKNGSGGEPMAIYSVVFSAGGIGYGSCLIPCKTSGLLNIEDIISNMENRTQRLPFNGKYINNGEELLAVSILINRNQKTFSINCVNSENTTVQMPTTSLVVTIYEL